MFWQKKEHINWPLIVFGILLVCVVVASIGLVVSFSSKVKDGSFGKQFGISTPVEVQTPQEITDAYTQELATFRDGVEVGEEFDEARIAEVQAMLVQIRVPQHMLDQHLDAFLRIQDPLFLESDQLREDVVMLLSELITAA